MRGVPCSAASEAVLGGHATESRIFDRKMGAKILLARLGASSSASLIYNLNGAFNYFHVGWWLRSHGFHPRSRATARYEPHSRTELFRLIATEVAEREVLYLEFGVAAGSSMRQWSALLRNPRSSLHGFDSFLGLPHDWSLEGHERGTFSTGGQPPKIDDPRVRFFTGWFDETLPSYRWPEHEQLVVVMDADLYSSTRTALEHVKQHLVPGSFLYFDQFHHRCDELRAFAELLETDALRFELVAASQDLSKVVFKQLA
jgi:hypothetical protein